MSSSKGAGASGSGRGLQKLEAIHDHQRLAIAVRAGKLGIWDYEIASGVITCDAQWNAIMGLADDARIETIDQFRAIIHPEDVALATADTRQTAEELLASTEDYSREFRIVRPDGTVRWIRSVACILSSDAGDPWRAIGFVSDITDARLAEQGMARLNSMLEAENLDLSRQALIDPLTGISNRRRFDQELRRACDDAARADGPLTLAMIDVDCFKAYNDHFGHAKGDQALKTVAETLAGAAWRPYHLAARYGGEEFALILPGSTDAAALVEDMRQSVAALRLPHPKSTASPYLSISCGMASRIPGRACSPESLLRASDAALYEAKQRGRNRVIAVRIRG